MGSERVQISTLSAVINPVFSPILKKGIATGTTFFKRCLVILSFNNLGLCYYYPSKGPELLPKQLYICANDFFDHFKLIFIGSYEQYENY